MIKRYIYTHKPVQYAPTPGITYAIISGGDEYSMYLKNNGYIYEWGRNQSGQLGINSIVNKSTPISIVGSTKTFCKIATGKFSGFAIDKSGQIWSWGRNDYGQLGNNDKVCKSTPIAVVGARKTFCHIAASGHALALDSNGKAWGWGYNYRAEIGDNTAICRSTPVAIAGTTKTFCRISAGNLHSAAIDKNNQIWSWGLAHLGQLGNGQSGAVGTTSQKTPVAIGGAQKTWCVISAGVNQSAGITNTGSLWTWGDNGKGQLGINSTVCKCTPVAVGGSAKTFCKVSVGYWSTHAIDKNGKAWGWGYNVNGELGDNTVVSKLTPVAVGGTTKTFCDIYAGSLKFVLALDNHNTVWSWGINNYGQLDGNSIVCRSTPIAISYLNF